MKKILQSPLRTQDILLSQRKLVANIRLKSQNCVVSQLYIVALFLGLLNLVYVSNNNSSKIKLIFSSRPHWQLKLKLSKLTLTNKKIIIKPPKDSQKPFGFHSSDYVCSRQ
ncbi:Hypothetical_protein [Hexamita inflata]|uniref:Hypothetical_protein n=1 Tax=Hexamita inflata TaxID=28002 RepID=A0AA86PKN2_9EUKA|nr:Hypothetical protein HINF_LOCUS24892 [Hexamita inflata]